MRLGGAGLRSAVRTAPAAYWASWADALPMISARVPSAAAAASAHLAADQDNPNAPGSTTEARAAGLQLIREGFLQRPGWHDLRAGLRPDHHSAGEPGEWAHGWQYFASSTREHHFRGRTVLAQSGPPDRAHLRSHSGRFAGAALSGAPTAPEFEIRPLEFRAVLLERLRLPLPQGPLAKAAGSNSTPTGATVLPARAQDASNAGPPQLNERSSAFAAKPVRPCGPIHSSAT